MTYYNYNDCRPEGAQTLPADEWRWQAGDRWVATVGETDKSWWGNDTPESIGAPTPHVYPIADVPTTGTLVYWDADGNEVERGAQIEDVVFGKLVERGASWARFEGELEDGTRVISELSSDVLWSVARALFSVNSLEKHVVQRIGKLVDVEEREVRVEVKVPRDPTPEEALDFIAGAVERAEDPFAEAGRWITKLTNRISAAARSADAEG